MLKHTHFEAYTLEIATHTKTHTKKNTKIHTLKYTHNIGVGGVLILGEAGRTLAL